MSGDSSTSSSTMSSMASLKPSDVTTNSSSNDNNTSESSFNIIMNFFLGAGGQVILFLSFGAMFAGIWFSGGTSKRKFVLPISVIGAILLYVSMYNYYSVALEIIGAIILAFVYASAFSYRVARTLKLA